MATIIFHYYYNYCFNDSDTLSIWRVFENKFLSPNSHFPLYPENLREEQTEFWVLSWLNCEWGFYTIS